MTQKVGAFIFVKAGLLPFIRQHLTPFSMRVQSTSVVLFCCLVLTATILRAEKKQLTPQKDTFTLQSNVDVVLVPVVVRDRDGRLVGDLTERDFQVFDNKKRQVISGFMIASVAPQSSSQKAFEGGIQTPNPAPHRFVILLFDDLHVSFSDLARSKEAAKRVLAELNEGEWSAVVSLSGLVNSGITRYQAILLKALAHIQPQTFYQKTGTDCPDMDYHQAELIVNEHDAVALQAAIEEVLNCNPSLDTVQVAETLAEHAAERVFALGEQDDRVSLASLRDMVKKTAALPGLGTLILISPGFPTVTAQAKHEESQIIDSAAISNVTISALDARGLYTTEVNASDRGATSTRTNQLKSEYLRSSMTRGEDIMSELADGTGGTYVHNTNDLLGGLKALSSPPQYLYLLEFHSKDMKHNDTYHQLRVRVIREGVRIQARKGYFAAKLPKAKSR
jgi:VWFA-related protein